MTRVLVVDDSRAVRELLVHILGSDPGLSVIGCAVNGEEALRMAQDMRPDVITMDLHMPHMDGFESTRRIMRSCPVPIVIVSGSDNQGEIDASFRAIEAGALMVVRRPFGIGNPAFEETARALVRTVKAMAEVKVVRRWGGAEPGAARARVRASGRTRALVLVGASTGGPAVLRDILAELPARFPLPLMMVQHLSPGFVRGMADWLSGASGYPVSVASDGEQLEAGRAYLAPDGFQVAVTRELRCALSLGQQEHGMRPSVSHMFRSLDPELRAATVAVLLTGMGKDGAHELKQLRDDGALTIAQDRASSAVYGMPGEAIRLDAAMLILEPAEIGKLLHGLARDPSGTSSVFGI
jgi:two-component system, chemotaxis family, protein-glutamate methylesterase/glutaminase